MRKAEVDWIVNEHSRYKKTYLNGTKFKYTTSIQYMKYAGTSTMYANTSQS